MKKSTLKSRQAQVLKKIHQLNYSVEKEKRQMPFYKTCPFCGANLDPGEKCDCQDTKKEEEEKKDECTGNN